MQLKLNNTVYTKYKTLNTQNELIMHWYPCIENTKEEKTFRITPDFGCFVIVAFVRAGTPRTCSMVCRVVCSGVMFCAALQYNC